MKNYTKKLTVTLAAALAAGTLAGCGGVSLDQYPSTVAATYGSEDIYLDEANFFLRYQQWVQEAMYWDYMGYFGYTDLWTSPSNDGSKNMGEYLKEQVMAQLWQTRVLRDHAAEYNVELTEADQTRITEAVAAVHENFSEEFFTYVNADDALITEWMTDNALAVKVWDAVKASAEVTVTDEECEMFTVESVLVTNSTETEETTAAADEAAEAAEPKLTGEALADEVLARLEAGEEFADFSTELGVTSSTKSFLKVTQEETSDALYLAGVGMATGDVRKVSAENGWYVVKCVSDSDEEATAKQRETAEDQKREDFFKEVYAGWAAESPAFEVKSCWDDVKFSGEKIYVAQTTAATEAETTGETASESGESTAETTTAAEETSAEETTAAN